MDSCTIQKDPYSDMTKSRRNRNRSSCQTVKANAHNEIQTKQLDYRQNWYRNLPTSDDHMPSSRLQHQDKVEQQQYDSMIRKKLTQLQLQINVKKQLNKKLMAQNDNILEIKHSRFIREKIQSQKIKTKEEAV